MRKKLLHIWMSDYVPVTTLIVHAPGCGCTRIKCKGIVKQHFPLTIYKRTHCYGIHVRKRDVAFFFALWIMVMAWLNIARLHGMTHLYQHK